MGLLGRIIESAVESVQDSSDSRHIEELKPKMINSAIANDFETWFEAQLKSSPFLYSQYNFYDNCERFVSIDDDCVGICFEIAKANVSDECVCNFATTLGYKPLSANGLSYSNGKPASERVLIKAFAEVAKERIEKALEALPGKYTFGFIKYDDGTDKNASCLERVSQKAEASAYATISEEVKLHQGAYFTYKVPKQEQKSAF